MSMYTSQQRTRSLSASPKRRTVAASNSIVRGGSISPNRLKASNADALEVDWKKGWLWKWTNMMGGFKRRWFVIERGTISYRIENRAESAVRGSLPLASLSIEVERGSTKNFVISNRAGEVFARIRCASEKERGEWICAIELAKAPVPAPTTRSIEPDPGATRSVATRSSDNTNAVLNTDSSDLDFDDTISKNHIDEPGDDDEDVPDLRYECCGSTVLANMLHKITVHHQDLLRQSDNLSVKLGFTPLMTVNGPITDTIPTLTMETGMLLGASTEFINTVLENQKTWSRHLELSDTRCKQMANQVAAIEVELERLRQGYGFIPPVATKSSSLATATTSATQDHIVTPTQAQV
eukprot:m.71679 g.71679  ORF g.71679 m.71679 type:complete len:352 (+) comp24379_c0_seq1:427-1482(+)